MDIDAQENVLERFLFQYPHGNINFMSSIDETEVRPFVVMAHVYGIVKSTPFGVDLAVADNTRRAIFSLKGTPHWKFCEEHLRTYALHETIEDPYAFADTWNQSFLFLIDPKKQSTVMGHDAFTVSDICMLNFAIEQFALYKVTSEVYREYVSVVSQIVPRSLPATFGAMEAARHKATHPNNSFGFKRRVYGPYQL